METLPERLDWLWFLGYDLDSDMPNHSVLSKARKRWDKNKSAGTVNQRYISTTDPASCNSAV